MAPDADERVPGDSDHETWSAIGRENLIVESFEGEFILYNKLSGETHVLNGESKRIIDAISDRPSSPEVVRSAMLSAVPAGVDMDLARIGQHLAILEQWGIAVRTR